MALVSVVSVAQSAADDISTAESGAFALDTRAGKGAIETDGTEALRHSNLWPGDATATETLAQDGVPLAEGLTGEGAFAWNALNDGTYTLTHTTYTNGVKSVAETATFVVGGRENVSVSGWSGLYDGAAHGVSVAVSDAISTPTVKYAVSRGGPYADEPPMQTDAGTLAVWVEVSAPGYAPSVHTATVEVLKRTVTLTSGSASKVYDATPLVAHEVAVGGDGFADGEGVTCSYTGSQFTLGTSTNTFAYALNANTKAENYDITTVCGTLTVGEGQADTEVSSMSESGAFTLDTRAGKGVIETDGTEALRHSNLWHGDATATVTLAQDGVPLAEGLTGEGAFAWNALNDGTYTLTHTTYTNGVKGAVSTAIFTVTVRDVPFTDGDVSVSGWSGRYDGAAHGVSVTLAEGLADAAVRYATAVGGLFSSTPPTLIDVGTQTVWCEIAAPGYITLTNSAMISISPRTVTLTSGSASKVYDGIPVRCGDIHVAGDGFADGEGATYDMTGSQTVVGESTNTFTYALNENTKASNYTISTVCGTLTVTKATIGGAGGEEPGDGTILEDGLSKFDVAVTYDGRPHTIDTNALLSVEKAGCTPTVSYSLTREGAYQDEAFAFTDVVATSFWYRISLNNANYADYVHEARLTITPRDIALVTVAPIADQEFAGAAVEPPPVVADGEPSIVTAADYTVSYSDNATPGTATLTLAGRGNYTGTKTVFFVIRSAAREVVFDALGGRIDGVSVTVTQTLARAYGDLPAATRAGYAFDGWFLGVTNGAPAAARGEPLLVDGAHTLYARWSPAPSASSAPETLYDWEATGAATARILGFRDPSVRLAQLALPDRIGGRFVTAVADGAFANTACGATSLALPVFCTSVGDRAFYNAASLASAVFADARRWDDPTAPATVSVGCYAFSTCLGLTEVTLSEAVTSLGDYAFLNCRNLRRIVVLGRPAVGQQVFRSAGVDGADGVAVLIDPSFADDADYMAQLKAGIPTVTVRTDAVVAALRTASLAVSGRTVRLSVDVAQASARGEVDASALRVECRARLGDAPVVRTPRAVVRGADGSLTLEVDAPEGASGFFRVRFVD